MPVSFLPGNPHLSAPAAWVALALTTLMTLPVGCSSGNAAPKVTYEASTAMPAPLTEATEAMSITIVYDNHDYDSRLRSDWGFACLIDLGDAVLLFDSGGDGNILLSNMSELELDPLDVDYVFLSHIHGDHTGGLAALLATGVRPVVWVPRSFPLTFKERVGSWTELREVGGPVEVIPGAHSTGELGSDIIEQSLVMETSAGLVVVTGCAHPGIVSILTRVKELHPQEIFLVLGGFHLGGKSRAELEDIVAQMQALGVQRVAPCHCTGDEAIGLLAEEWGDAFVPIGVGKSITLPE
jgi:7,8-dihydropterin-6-yl-methyl-4-(beta-D-ribofuranosyl)aminobenzene 5'-phosphate synthase